MVSHCIRFLQVQACALFVFLFAAAAQAQSSGLLIEAVPILGQGSPASDGWNSTLVRLENAASVTISGTLQLSTEPLGGEAGRVLTEAPFSIAAKTRVILQLPSHDFGGMSAGLVVRAIDANGTRLAESPAGEFRSAGPLLFDLTVPTRIGAALRGTSVVLRRSTAHYSRLPRTSLISVTNPQVSATTGELALPELAGAYAGATVVMATGKQLSGLSEPSKRALVEWVLAGGTLALSLVDAEDFRDPTLEATLGGVPTKTPPPRALLSEATFVVPPDAPGTTRVPPALSGIGRFNVRRLGPTTESASKLSGFTGGNLRQTPWGAAASYGLGEIHLLAFTANVEPFVSDPWTQYKLADLVRHAWERQSTIVLPHAATALENAAMDDIRRVLDPNEATRWTIIVSALALLLYAALAGPLNFYIASRKRHPLRALLYLPLWSAIAMLLIVTMGVIGKGVQGRARHLTLVESGAGMTRASATRFRGLYSSSASELLVRSRYGGVLDITGNPDETERVVVVDRDGVRLERLQAKPWQVLVVREDGFISLGGGISIVQNAEGNVAIRNRTAHDLIGAVLKIPGKNAIYFSRIADGDTVSPSRGSELPRDIGVRAPDGFTPLRADVFQSHLENAASGAGAAWMAFETLSRGEVEWWPDDVPVLIAQMEGGEGKTTDSGLNVDVDRVLVRVIGYGGVL